MKIQITIILSLLFFSLNILTGQEIINTYSYSFDDENVDEWEFVSIQNNGNWKWSQNGKADSAPYWDNRDAIQSKSSDGAVVYNASQLSGSDNIGFSTSGALVSPPLNFENNSMVFLRFHQYYRNFGSSSRIQFSTNDGLDWDNINTSVNDEVVSNVETGAKSYQLINISTEVGDSSDVRIRFLFEGDYYFWILDDIEFYDGVPEIETFPEYVGDSLQLFGYPYDVDENNWPYIKDQIVVQFVPGTAEPIRAAIRDTLGAILRDSCFCGNLELWIMGDDIIVDGDTLSSSGGSIGIQERVLGATTKTEIQEADLNKVNFGQMKDGQDFINVELTTPPSWIPNSPDSVVKVAILDTGIDLDHEFLFPHIYLNEGESPQDNNFDDDGNCLEEDWVGWNFVDGNNNPNDDHSHGTHVAGIVMQNMEQYDAQCYRLVPYKTHDYHGISTLFWVTCGTYQAHLDGASVINDSWGFSSSPSNILSNAIKTAKASEILIISSAGNDTFDLSLTGQYPACYDNTNIITVGAIDTTGGGTAISSYSNFSPLCVDILAPGDSIWSTVLDSGYGYKTGTSMAAPAVTAAAAMAYCAGHDSYLEVKSNILDCADKVLALSSFATDGNVLTPFNISCIVPVEELDQLTNQGFNIFPNPVRSMLSIQNLEENKNVDLRIHLLNGTTILQKNFSNWGSLETQEIDLESLPTGIFFLSILQDYSVYTFKLVKM